MRVLIIGNGGREHAWAWKLAQSPRVTEVLVAPGNPACATVARVFPDAGLFIPDLVDLARREAVDLTLVGHEPLLGQGIVAAFREADLPILGPDRRTAALTASRIQTKLFLERHHVPTSPYKPVTSVEEAIQVAAVLLPTSGVLIKLDGRLETEAVVAPDSIDDARDFIEAAFAKGAERLLLEARLRGREVAIPFLTDGGSWLMLPWARRLTRALDGDTGPVTSGVGAYAPAGRRDDDADLILREVVAPLVQGLQADGFDHRGWLQANVMFTGAGPQVLSLQSVPGAIESQVIMPVIPGDLMPYLDATLAGRLDEVEMPDAERLALGVLLSAPGESACPVTGLEQLEADPNLLWFGESLHGGPPSGWQATGRALTCVGLSDQRKTAQQVAYAGVERVRLGGAAPICRTDVGVVP